MEGRTDQLLCPGRKAIGLAVISEDARAAAENQPGGQGNAHRTAKARQEMRCILQPAAPPHQGADHEAAQGVGEPTEQQPGQDAVNEVVVDERADEPAVVAVDGVLLAHEHVAMSPSE